MVLKPACEANADMVEKLLDRMRRVIRVNCYSLRADVRTSMIYTHVVQRGAVGARSPLDGMI